MQKTLGITTLALLVLLTGRSSAQEADSPRAIVDRAIQAAGGAAKLAKYTSMTWNEVGTYHGMGTPLPYTGKYAAAFPDHFRMEIQEAFLMVYAGNKGWTKMAGEVKEMDAQALAAQKNDHQAGWISSLLPLSGKEFTLKSLGESKDGDRVLLGVQVNRADYPEVKLYFDKKTALLVRSVFRAKSPEENFKEVTTELNFSDYKDHDGALVACKLVMKRDGKVFVEAQIKDCKPAEKLDPALFAKP